MYDLPENYNKKTSIPKVKSKTLYQEDLVYKLKKSVGSYNFSALFIKIISHYKKIGYNH